jgi:ribosome maturation factor RimP
MDIISRIEETLAPLVDSEKMELVDVHYTTEHGKKILRVFLDKEGGFKLSDCEAMSAKIGELMDNAGIIDNNYILEVSSPGLDRVLKKEKDFVRFLGREASITMQTPLNGQRNFFGEIVSCKDGKIVINDVTGKTVELLFSQIANARLEPKLGI